MSRITLSPNAKTVTASLSKDVGKIVDQISKDLFTAIKNKTPVASGRAKRSWRLKKSSKNRYSISNKVPYATRLDGGYSNQAPKGMTRPSLREVATKYRR
jgi:hypothetical protein